jgi:LysM repeat protein
VSVGATLTIPLVDGVAYLVKSGDTLTALAQKYGTNADEVISLNNLTNGELPVGVKILIPDGTLPENERPGYVAPSRPPTTVSFGGNGRGGVNMSGAGYGFVPAYGAGGFVPGNCTWYAYNRRGQLGLPQPTWRGNANAWDSGAISAGWNVSRTPTVGAIFQSDAGWAGHVGIVEVVNADGSIIISEMNHLGLYVMNTRLMTPQDYAGMDFLQ